MNYKQSPAALIFAAALFGSTLSAQATPTIWESSFGAQVVSGDDSTANAALGMNFSFLGSVYTSADVSTNGFLSLGGSNGQGCCDGNVAGLLSGFARIAPAWYDMVSSVFLNTSVAGRAVFTWQGNEFSNSAPVLFQAQLFSNGEVIFGYDLLPPLEDGNGHRHNALTGVSGGGNSSDPGEIDYTTALPYNSGMSGTVYELFERGPNGAQGGTNIDNFDLAQTNICFTPNGQRGWNVSNCGNVVPEPNALALVAVALGGLGLATRRRKTAVAA